MKSGMKWLKMTKNFALIKCFFCVPATCPNPHFRAVEIVLMKLKADTEPLPSSTPHSSVVLFAAAGIFPTGKYDDLFYPQLNPTEQKI